MDKVHQLGKTLAKQRKRSKHALKRQYSEYGTDDIVRDIFDFQVPFHMSFVTPRKGMSVAATLTFEYPPPSTGSGNCCGDCYCAVCEQFVYTEVGADQTLLLSHPYVPGSIRVYDPKRNSSGVIETDPDAGIIDLNYSPSTNPSNYITVCYVHRYATNCTTNEIPPIDPCLYTDSFTRSTTGAWGLSDAGVAWSKIGTMSTHAVDGSSGILHSDSYSLWEGVDFLWPVPTTLDYYIEFIANHELITGTAWSASLGTNVGEYIEFVYDPWVEIGRINDVPYVQIYDTNSNKAVGYMDGLSFTSPVSARFTWDDATNLFTATVWQTSSPEPATPTASLTLVTNPATGSYLRIVASKRVDPADGNPLQVAFDNLLISGLNSCSTTIIDDWNDRTQTAYYDVGNTNGLSTWGYTSGTNDPWYVGGDSNSYIWLAAGEFGGIPSDGKCGAVQIRRQAGSTVSTLLTLNTGGSGYSPWSVEGAGITSSLFTGTSVTFSIDIMCTHSSGYAEIAFAQYQISRSSGLMVGINWSTSRLYLDTDNAVQTYLTRTFTTSVWYRVKVNVANATASVKVWKRDQEEEPASWDLTRTILDLPWTPGQFNLMLQTASGGTEYVYFFVDNFKQYT